MYDDNYMMVIRMIESTIQNILTVVIPIRGQRGSIDCLVRLLCVVSYCLLCADPPLPFDNMSNFIHSLLLWATLRSVRTSPPELVSGEPHPF
jgi:hypothetical protein